MRLVVTGASRGIGREVVKKLGASHQILALARNSALLETLKQESKSEIIPLVCDLNEIEKKRGEIEKAAQSLGRIDGILLNAASQIYKPFVETTPEDEVVG